MKVFEGRVSRGISFAFEKADESHRVFSVWLPPVFCLSISRWKIWKNSFGKMIYCQTKRSKRK